MVKISAEIDEELKNQFKGLAIEKYGKKKNVLALALKEAIDRWISEFKLPNKTFEDFSDSKVSNQKSAITVIEVSSNNLLESKEPIKDLQDIDLKLLYTIGYQNKNINLFIELLKKKEIKTLVDIRRNINSKKENFSGVELDHILRQHKITYVSLSLLGPPPEMRYELYDTKNYPVFFEKFKNYLNNNINYLEKINKLTFPICLLCYEDKASECHRSVVAEKLKELNNKWIIEHIELTKKDLTYKKDLTSFDIKIETVKNEMSING
ncbi:MAG: hypothetical protein MPEBLZ_04516 [Candidatus Methanoperedens nitroreducens]|uniref:DUF488 domain-containing protein n=1 Tax=Candidatus Methanoperedens nitratireducens TaxID=1392998 RepID=A0A0P8DU96_9EURY|nr:DUF488 domain-containing protein [Candidatus Methanoperedens sp. BLZ2]KAB2944872.1 MAG: DUF488 domain-containing protein [Candidatus Methanoperedens sp.]KPQ40941.1 MAG: hypothetical protein MPEBLZ_04516 [Candidatus Methanoperedens sp. BLZ1]MBZ0173745.1 DUF488 domain-containing protein [Candidatus Methanoperedens nitroreducens]CAG0999121.1 hypothetical protein METP2_03130 [Methanosarcinales archaeon]MCX9078246.1 DUF488 domain-containing protein [Candidatus Methanoperedens sp.]